MRLFKKLNRGDVGKYDFVQYLFFRGCVPLIRGILKGVFLNHSFPLFLGCRVKVFHGNHLSIGRSVYIGDYCHLYCLSKSGVVIGNNVTIREGGWMQLTSSLSNPGDSVVIGDDTYIGPNSIIGAAGPIRLGRRCQLGSGVNLIAENHNFVSGCEIFDQGVSRKGIVIEDDCWLGNNVIILDGVIIGEGSVVGAGSVVTKSFPAKSVVVGNPARLLKSRG